MTVTAGVADADATAGFRQEFCRIRDERLSAVRKIELVHDYLHREMAEVRLFLDHLEQYLRSLTTLDRQPPGGVDVIDVLVRRMETALQTPS
jgi:hypothetical protein